MKKTRSFYFLFAVWTVILVITIGFLVRALPVITSENSPGSLFQNAVAIRVLKDYVPGIYYGGMELRQKSRSFFEDLFFSQWQPLTGYVHSHPAITTVAESNADPDLFARAQQESPDNAGAGGQESDGTADKTLSEENPPAQQQEAAPSVPDAQTAAAETGVQPASVTGETAHTAAAAAQPPGISYSPEQLGNFSFLLNTFFTLDPTTTIDESLLNAPALLSKDLRLTQDNSLPQILIYHTHSQEEFADSTPNDPSTSILGVGDYLTKLLTEQYGYNVIHNRSTFDLVDGVLDRNRAYSLALNEISGVLEANPSVQVVIDLHRDGIEGNKMTTMINGKETAKFMFFNGLSRTAKNGEISYLYNPYIADNLAFSLQLQLAAALYYPDVTRPIYLKSYRYNLHLRPRCILVEAGSQKNTFQEELNAMEVLADLLNRVLKGEV